MTAPTSRPDAPSASPHDDALLVVRDLTVTYGGDRGPQAALESVSFAIGPGESYGLVGESGCGKSTVALAVMRYLPRNGRLAGGQILLEGQDLATLSGERLRGVRGNRLAMVYQDPGSSLNPAMRIGEQLAEVYRNHGRLARPAALDASRQMLDKVQMRDPGSVMTRYPHQLSGGMQQRVVIAMALAANPALLILDEPTTGLDATVEAAVLDLVGDLRRELGTAILFISHNLAVVARLCERIGVLYAGRLVEEGPTRDVFYAPRHPYTLGLLGCVPRFGVRKGSTRLLPIPGQMPRPGARGPGCRFMARCSYARDRCREEPPLLQPASGRGTRCWFWDELPATAAAYIDALAEGEEPGHAPEAAHPPQPTANTPALPSATPTPGTTVDPIRTGDALADDPRRAAPVLALDHLGKSFPGQGGPTVRAVQDVSLQVGRGRTFGLVGESGSGKSTLARVVAGLLPASSGQVSLDGSDVTVLAQRRSRQTLQRLQMVFQSPEATLNPSERIGTTLARSVRALGGLRGEALRQRVLALAASVNIDAALLQSYPRQLSGGQRQRVAIARAFAGDPELVLCDEPASALDVSVQAAILNLLVDIQERQGASYIFISHDLTVVRYLADDIGVMYLGRLVEVGPAERVFAPPFHPYTEMLFAAIPTLDFDRPPDSRGSESAPVGEVQRMPQQAADGPQPVAGETLAPGGCPFRLRCPRLLGPQCAEEPPWRETADGHRYLCWIPAETLAADQRALGTRP